LDRPFWAPVDDLGCGLDLEGWPEGGAPPLTKCEGRVTPAAGGPGGSTEPLHRAPLCPRLRPEAAIFFRAKAAAATKVLSGGPRPRGSRWGPLPTRGVPAAFSPRRGRGRRVVVWTRGWPGNRARVHQAAAQRPTSGSRGRSPQGTKAAGAVPPKCQGRVTAQGVGPEAGHEADVRVTGTRRDRRRRPLSKRPAKCTPAARCSAGFWPGPSSEGGLVIYLGTFGLNISSDELDDFLASVRPSPRRMPGTLVDRPGPPQGP
jgi:hypothetical protein